MEDNNLQKTILVTGGAGFIGSNFIRHILGKYPSYKVLNLDKLTYSGNLENLKDIADSPNYRFVKGDICDEGLVEQIFAEKPSAVVHFAAASHVDRSILEPEDFVKTNVQGTYILLQAALMHGLQRFVHIGSDEEYGSSENTSFKENSPLNPSNPYSATKAAASLLALAYFKTHHLPVVVCRCSNNFGPFQYPEKLMSLFITNLLEGKKVPLYGKGLNVRDWLFVLDNCEAIDLVLHKGKAGEVYNIGGGNEKTNLEITRFILKKLGKSEDQILYVKDRPGHDFRYSLNSAKIKEALGWQPKHNFEEALEETIAWYQNHTSWWKKIKSGEFLEYYKKQYGNCV